MLDGAGNVMPGYDRESCDPIDDDGVDLLVTWGPHIALPESSQPLRLQGVFVSDGELQKLVRHWKGAHGAAKEEGAKPEPAVQQPLWEEMREQIETEEPEDVLLDNAVDVVQDAGRASISLLQRRLRIGYTRAARLIDLMEEKGIVGPAVGGSYAREVLADKTDSS